MADFEDVFPAIIIPVTLDGRLNESAFREVMEFNIRSGVQDCWVAGGIEESVLLDDDENKHISEIAAYQSAGRAKNITHVEALRPIVRAASGTRG